MAENERSSKRRRLSAPSTQIQPRERDNVTGNRTELPCNADPISSHDLQHWRSLFGLYLDVQKHIEIETLTEREIKGRFKSFVGKWLVGFEATIVSCIDEHVQEPRRAVARMVRACDQGQGRCSSVRRLAPTFISEQDH